MAKVIVIEGELMDLNKYVNAQRANRFGGNSMKQKHTNVCEVYVKKAMNEGLVIEDSEYPLDLSFVWYTKDRRKDPDNVAFAKKFVLDGMSNAGLIVNDGRKQVGKFKDSFKVDKEKPRVEITIT